MSGLLQLEIYSHDPGFRNILRQQLLRPKNAILGPGSFARASEAMDEDDAVND
jgi:hypothetical protein